MKPGSSGDIGHAYGKTNPINVLKAQRILLLVYLKVSIKMKDR